MESKIFKMQETEAKIGFIFFLKKQRSKIFNLVPFPQKKIISIPFPPVIITIIVVLIKSVSN